MAISYANQENNTVIESVTLYDNEQPNRFKKLDVNSSAVKEIEKMLYLCNEQVPRKFRAKYKLDLKYKNTRDQSYLVKSRYMKSDGITYECDRNVSDYLERVLSKN